MSDVRVRDWSPGRVGHWLVQNTSPSITSQPVLLLVAGDAYQYAVQAADPDVGAVLTLTAPVLPTGAAFVDNGGGSGTLTWTPGDADKGDHAVQVRATDELGAYSLQDFTLTVQGNQPPAFDSSPLLDQLRPGYVFVYDVQATDPEGDAITLAAVEAPDGAVLQDFGGGAGRLTWTAGADLGGYAFRVQAVDALGNAAYQAFTLVVGPGPVATASQVQAKVELEQVVDARMDWDQFLGDLSIENAGLTTEAGIQTAVVVSLFSDRLAEQDDVSPGGAEDRRGWWADETLLAEGDHIGSRLWLLHREKETAETAARAQEYALQGLQWLVDDGIAAGVEVTAEWVAPETLALEGTVVRPDGSRVLFRFGSLWDSMR